VVGCLIFIVLAAALVLTGEVRIYAPRLTGLQPDPNFAFQPTTPITLTFDQPMDRDSVESSLVLEPAVSGTLHWNEASSQVVFTPSEAGYEPGTAQIIRLEAGAKAGTLPRTTESSVEWSVILPPLLDELAPPPGAEDLEPYPLLRASFNYPLDCEATSRTFSITPDADGIVECEGNALTYSPTSSLDAETGYVAHLEEVYLEGDSWPRQGVRWEFHTAPALSIREIHPPATDLLDDLWTRFRIAFNRPVLIDSAVSRFSLVDGDGLSLDGDLAWEDAGASLVFEPAEPLRPSSTYRLTLQGGVQDELGFELSETVELLYNTPPMVGVPSPAPGEKDVVLDSTVRVPFMRQMDKASVEAEIAISPAQDGVVTWEKDTFVFTPRGGLSPETDYKVVLSGDARDASGAPLAEPMRWAFSTQPFLLEARVPADAPLAELKQPIGFSFALPMDRTSVAVALTISPTTAVDLVWSEDSRAVALEPEPAWLPGTEYQITLAGTARTADGQQDAGEDLAYAFSTAVSEVQFGEGPNVQVMGSEGNRTFQVAARGADVADFRLHAITQTQLLDLYNPGFWDMTPEGHQVMDTKGLTPTAVWREELTLLGMGLSEDWELAEAHLPADVVPGMYVLTGEPPSGERAQLLVVLTNHALVLKRALAGSGSQTQAQVVVWDTEISGGAPVVSATIRLLDDDGASLAEGVTDADGLLTLDVPGDPGPTMALADKDGDMTICGLGNEWLESGSWWRMGEAQPSRPLYRIYSYTDRPIYRPGQDVSFKHLIRADGDAVYALPPPDLPVSVRLRDGRNNIVASQVLTLTQYGTVHGAFELADEPMLGTWYVETELEGVPIQQPFQVEEYRKPEYSVSVRTPQKTYVHGEAISVTVDAGYYFGQPVAGAEVVLRTYPVYPEQLLGDGVSRFERSIIAAEGQTDAQGRWTVTLPTEALSYLLNGDERGTLALEATVTDDTGQSVSSYQMVTVQHAALGLTVVLEKHGYEPNEEIALVVVARNRDGEAIVGAELVARVLGWDEEEIASAVSLTDPDGRASFSMQLAEQGWYALLVSGADKAGRAFLAEDHVWVYDPTGQAPVYGGAWGEESALSIGADRSAYAAGDQAQILIHTQLSGPAILSFERGETRHIELVSLTAGTNAISVPIRADYAPNIDVTVSQFGPSDDLLLGQESRLDAQLQTASTQLLVPMSDRRLTVTLTADQEAYGPGDEATFHVQVTDAQGRPREAEVSLAVVDEAIYALAEDMSKDLFDTFYGRRPNLVRTFDSMRPARWLFSEGFAGMGGGGDGLGEAPRRDFLDTALWAPVLITNENGEAAITLELPHNLTEWRALARAVTTDTLIGEADTHIVVSQDIVIQPVIPRFLVQGDAVSLAAVVHNFTTEPVSITVQLELTGLLLEGDPQQVLHAPAKGSATAAWPVVVDEALGYVDGGPAKAGITVSATASRGARLVGRDAVALSLLVYPLAVPETTTWAGELNPAWPTGTITLTVPSDVITAASRLEISLAPSLASGVIEGLDYLIDYPYGCVEQTMSRVLPNAIVSRAFRELGIRSELLEIDLPPMVALGLQRLYAFQHDDGGWGWWYDDDTDANQTAYVLFGLAMTKEAGFEVDEGVVERGADALRRMLPEADPRVQAYGAYSLVMAGHTVTVTLTLTDALQLDLFSQAALALALDLGSDLVVGPDSPAEMVAPLLDNLRETAIREGATVHWEEVGKDAAHAREVMGSTERTSAMVTDALVRLDPEDPLLPKAVRWLMTRRQGPGWGDTQKTSHAVMALTDYQLSSEDLATGSGFAVYVNGELWQESVLGQTDGAETLTLPFEDLLPGENNVTLVLGEEGKARSGRLYYAGKMFLNRVPGDEGIPASSPHERSILVHREYRLKGSQVPTSEFEQGDLVEVRLTLDVPEESWYVIIDDPLPAGFEALNERLGTASHVAASDQAYLYQWEEYGYNRKDVRDERVSLFITRLEPGQTTLTYLARAITAGSFVALPAQVYPMYEAEAWSRSDLTRCRIDSR
jgi:uncharacterized protein YfaS (alpha-2-macroglobulin family)